jgi:hypothetical protein
MIATQPVAIDRILFYLSRRHAYLKAAALEGHQPAVEGRQLAAEDHQLADEMVGCDSPYRSDLSSLQDSATTALLVAAASSLSARPVTKPEVCTGDGAMMWELRVFGVRWTMH